MEDPGGETGMVGMQSPTKIPGSKHIYFSRTRLFKLQRISNILKPTTHKLSES
jgi:hypothetical protein